jgi:hypothetical protein
MLETLFIKGGCGYVLLLENMKRIKYPEGRPPYSYRTLIAMAIVDSPGRRLRVGEICEWISKNFWYYRMVELDWRSHVRYCLSVNEEFVREVGGEESFRKGKGCYWGLADVECKGDGLGLKGRCCCCIIVVE